jgi:exonuclease III
MRQRLGCVAMRIATYNINGVKARLPRLLEWLEETRPDIACLQEVKSQDDGFPASEFERIGYGAIWHGQKSFNGVAILARDAQPTETARGLAGDPGRRPRSPRCDHLPTQWQPAARTEIRLQAEMDAAPACVRRRIDRGRNSIGAGGRL